MKRSKRIRMNITIRPHLRRLLRAEARRIDSTMSHVIEMLVAEHLQGPDLSEPPPPPVTIVESA